MDRNERKLGRFRVGVDHMSASERAAMEAALKAATALESRQDRRRMVSVISDIGAARGRAEQKRESDARTDARRRKLIGARLPRAQAERCKRCADAQGLSLYRFVCNALERECNQMEMQ